MPNVLLVLAALAIAWAVSSVLYYLHWTNSDEYREYQFLRFFADQELERMERDCEAKKVHDTVTLRRE